MDDYFQILIYLIIIFAFLNSLFKKKDKGEAAKKPTVSPPQQQKESYSSAKEMKKTKDEYDILREIEGIFKEEKTYPSRERESESAIEKAEMRKVPESEHTEDKEWHTEDREWHSEDNEWHTEAKEWHEKSTTEHELDKSWHTMSQYKRVPKIDKTIEKEAEQFEQMLESMQEEEEFDLTGLQKKLYSVESLKEYMIFSEILGKPKYLRR
jgi:hypothetical protein